MWQDVGDYLKKYDKKYWAGKYCAIAENSSNIFGVLPLSILGKKMVNYGFC